MSKIWLDNYELRDVKEFCNCGNLLSFKSLEKITLGEGEGLDYTFRIHAFKFLTCLACNSCTVLLYSTEGDVDSRMRDAEEGAPPCYQYSRQILYAPKKSFSPEIPSAISEVVNQAQAVLVSSPRASFILCRAALEEICNHSSIPTKEPTKKGFRFIGLKDRLSFLFDKESLPQDLQKIIAGIKDLGDRGAHSDHATFARKVQAQEAEGLLALVEYVIGTLYVDKSRQQEATEMLNELNSKVLSSEISNP